MAEAYQLYVLEGVCSFSFLGSLCMIFFISLFEERNEKAKRPFA